MGAGEYSFIVAEVCTRVRELDGNELAKGRPKVFLDGDDGADLGGCGVRWWGEHDGDFAVARVDIGAVAGLMPSRRSFAEVDGILMIGRGGTGG